MATIITAHPQDNHRIRKKKKFLEYEYDLSTLQLFTLLHISPVVSLKFHDCFFNHSNNSFVCLLIFIIIETREDGHTRLL